MSMLEGPKLAMLATLLAAACTTGSVESVTTSDTPLRFVVSDVTEAAKEDEGAPPLDTQPPAAEVGTQGSDWLPCTPDCAGKSCGDDGCGASCGECPPGAHCEAGTCTPGACQGAPQSCDDGDICTIDQCDPTAGCQSSPEPGPCSWPGSWHLEAQNPVLVPTSSAPSQGADNIYAPDVVHFQGQWWMFYGGQGGDGHDAVFVARSNDLVHWLKHPSDSAPQPVVDHGSSNHVNDPSVVLVGGTLYMYYTEAPTGEEDEIHLATSPDGLVWTKQGVVLDVGPPGSWEPDRVGRPSVLHEDGEFRMWYDGQVYGVARHVGYATSDDGYAWTKHPGNPILQHQGAVDVDRVGDWYVMLSESQSGTNLFVAKSPVDWHSRGQIWSNSGEPWDQHGQVTPSLLTAGGKAVAIFFGGASDSCWCKNRIAMAWPEDSTCEPSCFGVQCGTDGCGGSCGTCPDGKTCNQGVCEGGPKGCTGCLTGASSCKALCKAKGKKGGSCAHPGSTNPDECCDCDDWGPCEQCLDGYSDCKDACQHSGYPGGHCAAPSSTDPTECCACDPDTGCEGCLVGASSCLEACQGAGMSYGWCATPGSQDPSACCACL